MIGRLLRSYIARIAGPASAYSHLAIEQVNLALAEMGKHHPPMAVIHYYAQPEVNDGPEREAA